MVRGEAICKEHQELFLELRFAMELPELVALANVLPYDEQAAQALARSPIRIGWLYFRHWLDLPNRKDWEVAAYCAEAAQHAASKVLEQVLELSRQKKVLLDGLTALIKSSEEKGLEHLVKAIKKGGAA